MNDVTICSTSPILWTVDRSIGAVSTGREGRVAQRESACFTRKRSQVQNLPRPPPSSRKTRLYGPSSTAVEPAACPREQPTCLKAWLRRADMRGMAAVVVTHARRRVRLRAVLAAVVVVLAVAIGAGIAVGWVLERGEDPFESVPHVGARVFDYMTVPTIGEVYRAGDVDVVLLAAARLGEGEWGLHFVLSRDSSLPRYDMDLVPAGARAAVSQCAASGRSGWGECYVRVPPHLPDTFTVRLIEGSEIIGSFELDMVAVRAYP
jgi:hypothetical protein